jgi:carbamoyl-phosphate synthase large subunit
MAKVATRVMWQGNLKEALKFYDKFGVLTEENCILKPKIHEHVCVKEAVFPFKKLAGADVILSPEMKSTGEVMGISSNFGLSFAKSQTASFNKIPTSGKVFISLMDLDKEFASEIAKDFCELGFEVVATSGTHKALSESGIEATKVLKISEGRPNIEDSIRNNEISIVINTSDSVASKDDAKIIRQRVISLDIPYFTTIAAVKSAILAIKEIKDKDSLEIKAIQDYLS